MCLNAKQAFTLIEVVIAIAVLGIIISVVAVSTNIIQSAKLNAQYSQLAKFDAAIVKFHERYEALPGDITIAYEIWGSDCASISADCDGNGDSIIGGNGQDIERNAAWKHLELAELITGNFTISTTSYGGVSVPYGQIDDSMVSFTSDYNTDGTAVINGYNTLYLVTNDDSCNMRPVFSAQQMYLMDQKFDDGLPSGKIAAGENDSCAPIIMDCFDSATNSYTNIDDDKVLRCFLSFATSSSF